MENNESNPAEGADYEQIARALSDPDVRERLVFGNEELCNEIISRYLDELAQFPAVPTVRGYCALSPVPKPKTLRDAKRIVDEGI